MPVVSVPCQAQQCMSMPPCLTRLRLLSFEPLVIVYVSNTAVSSVLVSRYTVTQATAVMYMSCNHSDHGDHCDHSDHRDASISLTLSGVLL